MTEDEGRQKLSWTRAAGTFYAVITVAFTIYLIYMLIAKPLFPIQSDSAEWSSSWLLFAVVDYYHMAFCFVAIVIATENRIWAAIWSLLILILGAPFGCLYAAKQIGTASTLQLRENYMAVQYQVGKPERPLTGFVGYLVAAGYVVIGGAFGARLVWTMINYPLTEIASDDAEWSFEWFVTTVLDFYTISACLIGVIASTDNICPGLAWIFGILVIGGPPGSAWMAHRLFKERPLVLESA